MKKGGLGRSLAPQMPFETGYYINNAPTLPHHIGS